jgi:hydrogenase/urease accessory protein HupE
VETTTFRTGGESLSGSTLRIEGLGKVPTDVMLRVKLKDGGEHAAILRGANDSYTVPAEATKWEVAQSYARMGTEHILEGYDHLLFLVALLLIVVSFRKLLWTITAFTLAHSITLALSTLGLVNFPSAPTEAVISLSILFLAIEILRIQKGETPLTAKYPWIVSFSFGLFHGLGFAGALSEIGVPQNEVPIALLMFNVGVEVGQILFVSVVAGLLLLARTIQNRLKLPIPQFANKLAPYAIGSIAAYWTIERTMSFMV